MLIAGNKTIEYNYVSCIIEISLSGLLYLFQISVLLYLGTQHGAIADIFTPVLSTT